MDSVDPSERKDVYGQLRWAEKGVQSRSPRIAQSEWDGYKDEILQVFDEQSLHAAIKHMQEKHRFVAA